jgi:hypothetical protein
MMAVKRWTDKEDQFLRFNYVRYTNEILANQMERTSSAIKDRAARLGINKSGSRKRWTKTEHNYLAKNRDILPPSVIAKKLGRSRAAIVNRCTLFFKDPPEFDLDFDDLDKAHYNPFLTGKIGPKINVK